MVIYWSEYWFNLVFMSLGWLYITLVFFSALWMISV